MTDVLYPVSQIADGQIQAPTAPASPPPPPPPPPAAMTVAQVNQIADGQVQGGMHTVTLQMMSTDAAQGAKVTYIPANASTAASDTGPTTTKAPIDSNATAASSSTTDPAATTSPPPSPPSNTTTTTEISPEFALVSCLTTSTLTLSLSDGILTDSAGRTGYIASNYQFQFDNPPQSEALYTSGWSVCANGTLALGGTTRFWQCLSGEFYNLYDRFWAAQCSEVEIRVSELVSC